MADVAGAPATSAETQLNRLISDVAYADGTS